MTRATITIVIASAYLFFWAFDETIFPVQWLVPAVRWALLVLVAIVVVTLFLDPRQGDRFDQSLQSFSPVWLFLTLLLPSVALADVVFRSGITWLRLLGPVLVALSFAALESEEKIRMFRWLLRTALVMCLVSLLAGLRDLDWAIQYGDRIRLKGIFSHPGLAGFVGALAFTWSWMVALNSFTRRWIVSLIGPPVSLAVVLWADSRTGLIALVAGFLVISCLRVMEAYNARQTSFRAVNSVIIGICLIAFTIPVMIGLGNTTIASVGNGNGRELSDLERTAIWEDCVDNVATHPIAGVGLGMPVSSIDRRSAPILVDEKAGPVWYCHSAVLNYFSASGLLGGCALVLLIFGTLGSLGKGLARSRYGKTVATTNNGWVVMHGYAGVIVTLPFTFVEGGLQGVMPSLLIWFLAFGVSRSHDQGQAIQTSERVRTLNIIPNATR